MFSLIYACANSGANNRDAGHLRRHRAHYDVTVMTIVPLVSMAFVTRDHTGCHMIPIKTQEYFFSETTQHRYDRCLFFPSHEFANPLPSCFCGLERYIDI